MTNTYKTSKLRNHLHRTAKAFSKVPCIHRVFYNSLDRQLHLKLHFDFRQTYTRNCDIQLLEKKLNTSGSHILKIDS